MDLRYPKSFYLSSSLELAPKLLGSYLCRRLDSGEVVRRMITECECYVGQGDTACHASRGKTPRNAPMFEDGGIAYVYLCYGIHTLINVVSGCSGFPEAVLLRGVEGASGPGKLTKLMSIDMSFNYADFATSERIWIEKGEKVEFITTPRIGIGYASKEDQNRPWRFLISKTAKV